MATTYVTFGQDHKHEIGGVVFDKDCVASIECLNGSDGRDWAFDLFGNKFCFEYHEDQFDTVNMEYFPRGIIPVPQEKPVD